jgi:hypothetical protein
MPLRILAAAALMVGALCYEDPYASFLAPQTGTYAGNADLIEPWVTTDITECIQACLNYNASSQSSGPYGGPGVLNGSCVHVNVCQWNATYYRCGIGGYSRNYTMLAGNCT